MWATLAGNNEVTGEGYSTQGQLLHAGGAKIDLDAVLLPMALCADARLDGEALIGDPTEGALIVLAEKGGISIDGARAMLDDLASLSVVSSENADPSGPSTREATAHLVQQISSLTMINPQVAEVDARHVQAGVGTDSRLAARSVAVTIADAPVLSEPAARRI